MERKLQERLVGAGVLILALVIVGPMILDGRPGDGGEPAVAPGQRPEELRSQTFRLDDVARPQPAGSPVPTGESAAVTNPPTAPVVDPQPAAQTKPAATTPQRPALPAVAPASVPASSAVNTPAQRPPAAAPPPAKVASGTAAASPQAEVQTAAPTGGGFVVQVGTFGQKENAERLVATLKGRGFAAFVSPVSRDGKTLHRVRVGPAGSRQSASELAARLAAAGQAGQVVAQ